METKDSPQAGAKLHIIDVPCPEPLPEGATGVQEAAYQKHIDDDMDGDRDLVGPRVLKMIGYMKYLATLGSTIGLEAQIDPILQTLNINYAQFVMNYNMNEIEKTPTELLAMLKTVETNIQKASPAPIMMVNKGSGKGKGERKGKKRMRSKSAATPKTAPKQDSKPGGGVAKGDTYHYYKNPGHFKRNYHSFLEDLKKKKAAGASDSGNWQREKSTYVLAIEQRSNANKAGDHALNCSDDERFLEEDDIQQGPNK
ncbi:hypothetical protein AgCh_027138 [Apium graveolens]